MISIRSYGSTKNIENFLTSAQRIDGFSHILEKYAQMGVIALAEATPKDTGKTAFSWGYEIKVQNGKSQIIWTNSNVVDGIPVAILIQYGHADRGGTFIEGLDYINPALKPIFDELAKSLWREVKRL